MKKVFITIIVLIVSVGLLINLGSVYTKQFTVNSHDKEWYQQKINSGEISLEDKTVISLLNAEYNTIGQKKAFKESAESYNILVEYLLDLIDIDSEKQYIFGINNKEGNLRLYKNELSVEYLDLDETVKSALTDVYNFLYDNTGYSVECIRIKEEKIMFDVIDGTFSIIYFIDNEQIPKDVCKGNYHTETDYHLEKLKGNWYVMVK